MEEFSKYVVCPHCQQENDEVIQHFWQSHTLRVTCKKCKLDFYAKAKSDYFYETEKID